MFETKSGEQIILAVHRHWFVIGSKMTVIIIMLLIAVILTQISSAYIPENYTTLAAFLLSIYILIILLISFILWVDYYLDMWIITNERVISIEQRGLFNREISEFMLSRVQDVTVEIPDFFATVFKFGNIIVQTAGEKQFIAKNIPNAGHAKDIILEYAQKNKTGSNSPNLNE
ncbi:MAG: PH domain-containing protein [Candidatus Niyogibacteria bacterium]|nr:PH domain-containing protein [Candidatus Niyogibacteria bacterium]